MKAIDVLITGANRGIGLFTGKSQEAPGRFTAKGLAQLGASMAMACRDVQHSIKVCETIKSETGNPKNEVTQLLNLRSFSSHKN